MHRTIKHIFFILTLCFSCQAGQKSIHDNILEINLNGYIQTCLWWPIVSVKEHGIWRQVNNPFNNNKKPACYLDDKFIGIGMCDVVRCVKINKPLGVRLVEYVEVGKKEAPYPLSHSDTTSWGMLQMYKTVPLYGEIKIEFTYFIDSTCSKNKTFRKIFKR